MQFCFYPQHEHGCPHVSHCPHLGGAALGALVLNANTSGDTMDGLHRTIEAERKRNAELVEENLRLEKALGQAKLELKLERQNKFATNQQKQAGDSAENKTAEESATHESKKRGAPVGHPGWFRPTPTHYPGLFTINVGCVKQVDTRWCVTSANGEFRGEHLTRRAIRLAQRTTEAKPTSRTLRE